MSCIVRLNHYLGPAALIGPHVRSCCFGGREYLCAAEHLRGVAQDEGNRFGKDESRQVDELLNCGNPTSRPRPLPPVEGDLEEMSRDDADVGMDVGRVVLLCVRNIFEKLKSLCSLRRLHVVPLKEAGETAASTREKGRALSTENEAGTR